MHHAGVVEFSVSLGGARAVGQSVRSAIANDNTDRDQELFERSVQRELVDDENGGSGI